MRKTVLAGITFLVLFSACKQDKYEKKGTYNGSRITMGSGEVYSWVDVDDDAIPQNFGITLTAGALDNLPDVSHGHSQEFRSEPPTEAHRLPFINVVVNYNPVGHSAPFYNKEHFDFHFYMITESERVSIPEYKTSPSGFHSIPTPTADYLPKNYEIPGPPGIADTVDASEPRMGLHWVDTTSREFRGQPFTETFVYGSYSGKIAFWEPMITWDFLKNQLISTYQRAIPWASKVQKSGYYPKTLLLRKADGEIKIIFTDLEFRQAS
jgi:hypothetical protein